MERIQAGRRGGRGGKNGRKIRHQRREGTQGVIKIKEQWGREVMKGERESKRGQNKMGRKRKSLNKHDRKKE